MKLNPYTLPRTGVALGILAMITALRMPPPSIDADPTGNGSYGEIKRYHGHPIGDACGRYFPLHENHGGTERHLVLCEESIEHAGGPAGEGDVTIEGTIDVAGGPNGGAVAGCGRSGWIRRRQWRIWSGRAGKPGRGWPGTRGGIAANGANLEFMPR